MSLIYGLHFNAIKGDLTGGLTAAAVALPLAIAFGVLSGAGPTAGIYAAIIIGLFAALFGATPAQISGPTAPMTVLMAAIILHFINIDPVNGLAIALTAIMLGGVLQIAFGALKLEQYIIMIPHPVISGLMSGLGITIILLQIAPLLGHGHSGEPWHAFLQLPNVLAHPATEPAMLGIIGLLIMYLQPKSIGRFIPAPLTAMVVGTSLFLLLFPDSMIKTIGNSASFAPSLHWPVIPHGLWLDVLQAALALAVLATIDTLMTSLLADNISTTHHKSDRELIGQGIANLGSGLLGGIAGSGAKMRTILNIRHGGTTPLSGVFHSLFLILAVSLLTDFIALIPVAVLAPILIRVASDLIDWDYIKRLHKAPKPAVFIMFTVLILTVFADLLYALGAGITLASLVYMKRLADLQLEKTSTITNPDNEHPLSAEEAAIMQQAQGRILLFHVSGPMSFGAAKSMVRRVAAVDNYEALVLDLSDVSMIDFTSSIAIEDIILDAQEAGHHIFLSGATRGVREMLESQGILGLLLPEHQYKDRLEALQHASELLK